MKNDYFLRSHFFLTHPVYIAGGSGFYDEDYDDDYDYDDNYIEHVYGSQKEFSPGYNKQKVSNSLLAYLGGEGREGLWQKSLVQQLGRTHGLPWQEEKR